MSRIAVSLTSLCLLLLFSQCGSSEVKFSPQKPFQENHWFYLGDALPLDSIIGSYPNLGDNTFCLLEKDGITLGERVTSRGKAGILPIPESTGNAVLELSLSSPERRETPVKIPFYYLQKEYGRISLTSYPPLPMAGSIVEVRCRVENPGEDPYVRWSLDGKSMGEGFFSEGLDRYCFFSPRKKGTYTVRAEIFPGKPIEEGDRSPWAGEEEIFLNETADAEGELSPGEWENLFFCDGTHIDRGRKGMKADASWALNSLDARFLSPVILDGDRGYGFTSQSSLRYDGKMLEGINRPLSRISARLLLRKPRSAGEEETTQIFNTRDGRGDFGFTLFLRDNQFQLSWQLASDRFLRSYTEIDDALYDKPFWLSVEVEQRGNALLIRWYLDGILVKEEPFPGYFLPPYYEGGGQTVWGKGDTGYPSFEGVLFEWGFTSQESADPAGGERK